MTTTRTVIRSIQNADFQWLDKIENDADTLLIDTLRPDRWQPAPPGDSRRGHHGFVLVASSTPAGAVEEDARGPMGFIDVRNFDLVAYVDTLAVRRIAMRRGLGRELLNTALERCSADGHSHVALRTYRSLPFNAPFYASAGFREYTPGQDATWAHNVIEAEEKAHLPKLDDRIFMERHLSVAT